MGRCPSLAPVPAEQTYRAVFADRRFSLLWAAQLLSRVGDQLAAVALAVLVYGQTGSTLASAATYAIGFLPAVLGGPFLAGLADQLPRRPLMVGCDLIRALLVALMALPGMPLGVLLPLLFVNGLLDAPFSAARSAFMADLLTGDRYVMASAITSVTNEAAQVGGFLLGGAGVALLGARGALLADAATYAVSALLVRAVPYGDADRPPSHGAHPAASKPRRRQWLSEGGRHVLRQPELRRLATLAWLAAFYVVPEALAVPYAAQVGAGSGVAGILLAANPAGTVLGALALARFVPERRRLQLMLPLAVLSCVSLLLCWGTPPWQFAAVVLVISGAASSYNLPANAAFVQSVPAHLRGGAFGLVGAGMSGGQGLALLAAGALGEVLEPGTVIAVAGAAGTAVSLGLVASRRFVTSSSDRSHTRN